MNETLKRSKRLREDCWGPRKLPQLVNGANTLEVKPTGLKATRDAKKPIRSLATLIIKL